MYDFIELFAPHLTRDVVEAAFQRQSKADLDDLFSHLELPTF
jgi:LysR family cys regulon transcriptional activator